MISDRFGFVWFARDGIGGWFSGYTKVSGRDGQRSFYTR